MSGSELSWTEVLSGVDKSSHGRRFKVQLGGSRGMWIVTDTRGGEGGGRLTGQGEMN